MQEQKVVHSTFVIERSYPAPPERVFEAFADPAQKRRWFGGDGYGLEDFRMDFRAGGCELARSRMTEDSPFPGVLLTSELTYQDIVPNERIVTASAMTLGDKRISASLVTFELLATPSGTDLICTHQGAFFEGSDGPQRREAGWQKLLDRLATEVTAGAAARR